MLKRAQQSTSGVHPKEILTIVLRGCLYVPHAYRHTIHKAEIWDYHKHPSMDEWKKKAQGAHIQWNTSLSLKR